MSPANVAKPVSLILTACLLCSSIVHADVPYRQDRQNLNLYAGTLESAILSEEDVAPPIMNQQLALNMDDLGFGTEATTGDPMRQKRMNKRTKMLKIHQMLGLATGVAMALALSKASGAGAKGEAGKDTREDHEKYGIAAGALYLTTASFAFFVPKDEERKATGRTKIHKALAWIHFPAMLATMYLGITDKRKLDRGEDASGLKPAVATTAAVSFYTALAIMIIPFGGTKK